MAEQTLQAVHINIRRWRGGHPLRRSAVASRFLL